MNCFCVCVYTVWPTLNFGLSGELFVCIFKIPFVISSDLYGRGGGGGRTLSVPVTTRGHPRKTRTNIYAWGGIRTHDPSF
jgi:hypothetical protein